MVISPKNFMLLIDGMEHSSVIFSIGLQKTLMNDWESRISPPMSTSRVLIRKGEEVGLRFTGLVPQYRFLIGLGILQEMESLGKEMSEMDGLKLRLSLKHLIEPEAGMGEIFKVLIQHKGIEQPSLDGLRDLGSIPWPSS